MKGIPENLRKHWEWVQIDLKEHLDAHSQPQFFTTERVSIQAWFSQQIIPQTYALV